jgi:hypothetical protein
MKGAEKTGRTGVIWGSFETFPAQREMKKDALVTGGIFPRST